MLCAHRNAHSSVVGVVNEIIIIIIIHIKRTRKSRRRLRRLSHFIINEAGVAAAPCIHFHCVYRGYQVDRP